MRIMAVFSKIQEINIIPKEFSFKEVSSNKVKKIKKKPKQKKKSASSSCIPVSILIDSMDIYLPLFTDMIPLFKRTNPFLKTNY